MGGEAGSSNPGGAVRAGRGVCVATAVGVAVAATILLTNLIRAEKVAGVLGLLFLAVPALVVGQLWAIAVLLARLDRSGPSARGSRWRINTADPRVFFEGLPPWQAFAVMVVFVLSWVAGATAFRHLGSGGPTSPAHGCPYRLVNHGEYSCVSRSTYIAAAAAEQRLASGAFLGFFVVQFGVAAAELRRRRGRTSDEDREPPATTDERLVPGA